MTDALQMEENLREQLSDQLHFRQERATPRLTYGKMQHIAFITLEHALVTLEWEFDAVVSLYLARELLYIYIYIYIYIYNLSCLIYLT